jgi:membrane peptidoglycan carboxypeptidase
MSAIPQLIRSRHRREKRGQNNFSQRVSKIVLVVGMVFSLIISLSIIAFSIIFAKLSQNLPSLETLPLILEPQNGGLLQPTRLYDRSGEHIIAILENSGARGRQYLSLGGENQSHVPDSLVSATVASADPSFWTNPGFTTNIFNAGYHPSIPQRLIRAYLLWDQPPSFRNSLIELILAAQVKTQYGPEKILEWYLNSTYYGNLAYGADAAARVYFAKPASKLSLAEAAVLAAAAESPSLNPIDAPIASLQAKDRILNLMYEQGRITADQLHTGLADELSFQTAKDLSFDLAPDFTKLVVEQAADFIPPDLLLRGGFNINTSLDNKLQNQIECTTLTQTVRIINGSNEDIDQPGLEDCEMARLLPSLQLENNSPDRSIDSSVVVMDPNSGQILALVGREQPNRSPGSILTPFIYLTYFSRGASPATLMWDIPASLVEGYSNVQNPDGQFHGPVNIRTAMANDYLVPALQTLSQMNPDQVWHTAQQLGLNNLHIPAGEGGYLLPFQGGAVSLIELSQAYGVFASQGSLAGITQETDDQKDSNLPINPQYVLKVDDIFDHVWLDCTEQITECRPIKRPVITPQLAYLVTDILSDETARWPSLGHPNPLEIGRPAAVKIGRTTDQHDSWTVGYTPDLVTGVWLGTDDSNQEAENISLWSAGIWHAVMQYTTKEQPIEEFIPPTGISEVQVCYPSGLLPTDECPHLVDEIFMNGNEPTHSDNLYQAFLINRETGRLATIFTSPALIDEEIFMVVPPQAQDWAEQTNLPPIPEAYDVLDINPSKSNNAQITSPSMFSTVKGSVPINGRAVGNGFEFYRLQAGSGLNPQSWLQIGDDVHNQVQNGLLGVWDTSSLSGLYALQLIVTYNDETVESTTIQVTVDNHPPEVDIVYPQDEQKFVLSENNAITILADVSDDLELSEVDFYIDEDKVATLQSPPYVYLWEIELGEHILRVRALDRAGNVNDTQIRVFVEK